MLSRQPSIGVEVQDIGIQRISDSTIYDPQMKYLQWPRHPWLLNQYLYVDGVSTVKP